MGYMTRGEMVAVIQGGQSVLHKGRLFTKEADLPTAAQLAVQDSDLARQELLNAHDGSDPARVAAAEAAAKAATAKLADTQAATQALIEAMQKDLAALKAQGPDAGPSVTQAAPQPPKAK